VGWLLDTHVWIWSQMEPERLGPETRALLQNPTEDIQVATVSTLELARLVAGGQITLATTVTEWVAGALAALNVHTVELSHAVAVEAYALPEPFHRDPADRMLVATARLHDLGLITADSRILAYPHVRARDATL